jgi:sec-independent protein translocase protein TatC
MLFQRPGIKSHLHTRMSQDPSDTNKSHETALPMTLWEHLATFRTVLLKTSMTVVVLMLLSFAFRGSISSFIQSPLLDVDPTRINNLQSLGVADSMTISIKLSFYSGLVLSFPFILYFIAQFILPALSPKERRLLFATSLVGFGLFIVGLSFSFFVVLPLALEFFFKDAQMMNWVPTWTVGEYYSFVTNFVLAFGLSFELPVVVLTLTKLGIITPSIMRATRPHATVLIFVLASILTPTTDVFTLVLMAGPLLVLYEACIWIAFRMEKKASQV